MEVTTFDQNPNMDAGSSSSNDETEIYQSPQQLILPPIQFNVPQQKKLKAGIRLPSFSDLVQSVDSNQMLPQYEMPDRLAAFFQSNRMCPKKTDDNKLTSYYENSSMNYNSIQYGKHTTDSASYIDAMQNNYLSGR